MVSRELAQVLTAKEEQVEPQRRSDAASYRSLMRETPFSSSTMPRHR
jgi:hypothetical protein